MRTETHTEEGMRFIRALLRAPANRNLSTSLGLLLLVLAFAPGVMLPIMIPLLFAAEHYLASGESRYYVWFRDHKHLGGWLRAYHAYGVPPRAKRTASFMTAIWVMVAANVIDGAPGEYTILYWALTTITVILLPYRRHPRA